MQNSLEFKLNSCKRKNVEILLFLSTLRKEKEYPVTEFESNLRNVQDKMEKLLGVCFLRLSWFPSSVTSSFKKTTLKDHPDGSCSLILDEFYPLLVGFERQLQEMKSKGMNFAFHDSFPTTNINRITSFIFIFFIKNLFSKSSFQIISSSLTGLFSCFALHLLLIISPFDWYFLRLLTVFQVL